jgi:hypothetical protein
VFPKLYVVWAEFVVLCIVNLKTASDVAAGVSKVTVKDEEEWTVREMPAALTSSLKVPPVSATTTFAEVEL